MAMDTKKMPKYLYKSSYIFYCSIFSFAKSILIVFFYAVVSFLTNNVVKNFVSLMNYKRLSLR